MRVLVTGGAGFIGSHFVRRLAARGDEVVVLDRLTYAGNPANLEGVPPRSVDGDIADADDSRDGGVRLRRGRQLRRRDARRSLDPRPARVRPHRRARHPDAARMGPGDRRPLRAGVDRRGLRRPRDRRPVARGRSAAAVEPVLGGEGGRRPPGARLRPHLRRGCVDHAGREHLRLEPVPGEADPALRHERARRSAAARLRRRQAGARVAARGRPLRRGRARPARGRPRARSTTSAATSSRTSRSCTGSSS